MKQLTLPLLLSIAISASSQKFKLAEPSDHYKTLRQLSASPDQRRAWMDTIKYPPSEYGSSIIYLLVKPHYITEDQVKDLSESLTFPANSSDQVRAELD